MLETLPSVRGVLRLDYFTMGAVDRTLILWTVWSMSVIVLIPSLVIGRLATRLFGGRWGAALFVLSSILAASLTAADLYSYGVFGRHLWQFLDFAGERHVLEVAGDKAEITNQIAILVLQITLASVVCFTVCYVAQAKIADRLAGLRTKSIRLLGIACLTLLVFLPLSLHSYVSNKGYLERVWIALPVDLRFDRGVWRNHLLKDPSLAEVDRAIRETYTRLFPLMMTPKPADDSAVVTTPDPPNVVLIVVESLRYDVMQQGWMPRLSKWAERGLILDNHNTGSNCTELGLFGLLYGRSPIVYNTTLAAGIPPQLCVSLKNSGYRTAFFSSHQEEWERMEEFANGVTFDQAEFGAGEDWPLRDRTSINKVRAFLESSSDQPAFVFTFLMSTHYEYRYPDSYERYTPVNTTFKWKKRIRENPTLAMREGLLNRYKNALLFTDDLLADLIAELDPQRHIIIVTGDHGESFYDDGTYTHANKLSDVQLRSPIFMVGPGIPRKRIQRPTRHADLVPTLLHALNGHPTTIAHCHGRDLLGDTELPDCMLANYRGRVVINDGDLRFKCLIPFDAHAPRARLESLQNKSGDPIATPPGVAVDPKKLRAIVEYEMWLATQ